jgi:hypothetical protein
MEGFPSNEDPDPGPEKKVDPKRTGQRIDPKQIRQKLRHERGKGTQLTDEMKQQLADQNARIEEQRVKMHEEQLAQMSSLNLPDVIEDREQKAERILQEEMKALKEDLAKDRIEREKEGKKKGPQLDSIN